MKHKLILLLVALSFAAVAQAVPVLVNGGFDTVDDVDGGPGDLCYQIPGIVSIASSGWNVEVTAVPWQNAAVTSLGFKDHGDFTDVRNGNYLTLAYDPPHYVGGVWQNLGAMVPGETYTITARAFTADQFGAPVVDYTVVMELYSGSIAPGNLLDRNILALDATSNLKVINSGLLAVSVTAPDTSDLILRIAMVDQGPGVVMRGGVDDVMLPGVIPFPYGPTPADGATNVGTVSAPGQIDPIAASWHAPQVAVEDPADPNLYTVEPNPDVINYNVFLREAASTDPNFYLIASPVSTSATFTGLATDTLYEWRVDAMFNDANAITSPVWTFRTTPELPVIQPVAGQFVYSGATAQFTVSASDPQGGMLGYQWHSDPDTATSGDEIALVDGGDISGVSTATLSIANAKISDEGAYFCRVTNTAGSVDSNRANLLIKRLQYHWPLDGSAVEANGTGYDGVIEGDSLPSFVAGKIGAGAISLNDTQKQKIRVADIPLGDSGQITLSCWVQPANIAKDFAGILSKWNDAMNANTFFVGQLNIDGAIRFSIYPNNGAEFATDTINDALVNGQWTYLVCTNDGQESRVYANGELRGIRSNAVGFSDGEGDLLIGNVPVAIPSVWYFGGLIDDVKIYNYARTQAEVAADYLAVQPGEPVCVRNAATLTTSPVGIEDLNGDCVVDLEDFAMIALKWLSASTITQ